MAKSLRSDENTYFDNVKYGFLESFSEDSRGLLQRQAPTGAEVIGRVLKLTKGEGKTKFEAYQQIAQELTEFWIYGLNIYPVSIRNIKDKVSKIYEGTGGYQALRKAQARGGESWLKKVKMFNDQMLTGFDIRKFDRKKLDKCVEQYQVKMKTEDVCLWEDNCRKKTCICSWSAPVKCRDCPRQMVTTTDIDQQWKDWLERKFQDQNQTSNQQIKADDAVETMKKVNTDEAFSNSGDPELAALVTKDNEEADPSEDFTPPFPPSTCSPYPWTTSTRSSSRQSEDSGINSPQPEFPQIPLRFGRNKLNPTVMKALVHCQSTYKASDNDIKGIIVDFMNMVCGQKWEKEAIFDSDGGSGDDSDSDDEDLEPRAVEPSKEPRKKKRRVQKNLTYRFPSRATRRKYLRYAALLNLRYVARRIIQKKSSDIITYGFDDTTKAAGFRLFDVKTDHITINSAEMEKETLTTGFTPNLSHSGQDQTTSVKFKLQTLAVLAGEDTTLQDIIDNLDFWISDRSADCDVVLDELGIDDQNILKCNGHVVLTVDDAVDHVLKDIEAQVGRDKLAGDGLAFNKFKSKSSIATLGLIAICKCLSPSHAALSYSLYQRYKNWREEQNLPVSNFKGFQSNRFGRISSMAKLFLQHKPDLLRFFETHVDEHSNQLVLALSNYFQNSWFELGCQVFSMFGDLLINPLCQLLGIDQFAKIKNPDRNWAGVKSFFEGKLEEIKNLAKVTDSEPTSLNKVVAKCAEKVVENLERQLYKVAYMRGEVDTDTASKMKFAPLTNSGCESRMAELDVRVKYSGGSAPVPTISDKQVVAKNKYLLSDDFDTAEKTEDMFLWAKSSAEAKMANDLQKEFLDQVKEVKVLAVKAKESMKTKKIARTLKILEKIKKHGGPVTADSLNILDSLSEDQIIAEVSFLKLTVAPDLRLRKRVKNVDTNRFKMLKLPVEQLKMSIQGVLRPVVAGEEHLDNLLAKVFV